MILVINMPNNLFDDLDDQVEVDLSAETLSSSDVEATEYQPIPLPEKLACLLSIANKVENPTWAVSFEEIQELLIDLGLLLCEVSEDRYAGIEVKEDDRHSDALGNVLMTHRKVFRNDQTELLQTMGAQLLNLCQCAGKIHRKGTGIDFPEQFEDYDDAQSEDILAAKRLIRSLRKENFQLDRRNQRLYTRIQKLSPEPKPKREWIFEIEKKRVALLDSWSNPDRIIADFCLQFEEFSIQEILQTFDDSFDTLSSTPLRGDDKGMQQIQPRKLNCAQNAESQLDTLKW
jgi:hypothetical protein